MQVPGRLTSETFLSLAWLATEVKLVVGDFFAIVGVVLGGTEGLTNHRWLTGLNFWGFLI